MDDFAVTGTACVSGLHSLHTSFPAITERWYSQKLYSINCQYYFTGKQHLIPFSLDDFFYILLLTLMHDSCIDYTADFQK
jgi:hypothetical protein